MADLGFHLPSLVVYLVNFVILLVVLYAVGYKPILRMLDQRSEGIRESVEMVERVRDEAAVQQADMQKQMQEGRQEGQALLTQAREMAEKYRADEEAKARQAAEDLVSRAKTEIQREKDEAIDQVRVHFSELAILAAERVIERSLDSAAHKDIIEKVLEENSDIKSG